MIPGMKPHYEDLEVLTEEKECDSGFKEMKKSWINISRTKKKRETKDQNEGFFKMLKYMKFAILYRWIILDSQSNIDVFNNSKLLTNISNEKVLLYYNLRLRWQL